jgi:SGNH domain-containing protein
MMSPPRRVIASGCVALAFALAITSSALATTPPTPGTPLQVAGLVKASSSVTALPSPTVPALGAAPADTAGSLYPSANKACVSTSQCVFGDRSSTTTIVLYGDSHAQMWLPALVPVAKGLLMRLVLLWHPGCPVVAVRTAWAVCSTFRESAISMIRSLKAAVVLLADKNSNVVAPGGVVFTNAQWVSGMESTIRSLAGPHTKVAVVEDVTVFNARVPDCLASNPADIQRCSVLFPNPKYTQHDSAERSAAVATGAGYVATQSWLCLKRCSPMIGNMIVDLDADHVTATYAQYLTTVWSDAVKAILKG